MASEKSLRKQATISCRSLFDAGNKGVVVTANQMLGNSYRGKTFSETANEMLKKLKNALDFFHLKLLRVIAFLHSFCHSIEKSPYCFVTSRQVTLE